VNPGVSFEIQKFVSPGMLEFIQVEVYTSETLGVFLNVLSISQFFWHPQGKNIQDDEFSALSDMLATMKWELPQVEEYKGDLVMPSFAYQRPENQTRPPMAAIQNKPSPDDPCNADQWGKVQKMVA